MSNESKAILAFVLVSALAVGGVIGLAWYSAGLQAAVYKRQGIELTQWECFMGIEPAERVVQVRESNP